MNNVNRFSSLIACYLVTWPANTWRHYRHFKTLLKTYGYVWLGHGALWHFI